MATMAAYLVQQGGQPVGSGQTALLTSHPSDHAAALAGPNVPTSEFCESNRRSLRPAPSSHPEIKGAVSVRRYECVAALRRFDSRPVSSNFGDLMADAPIPIETPGVRSHRWRQRCGEDPPGRSGIEPRVTAGASSGRSTPFRAAAGTCPGRTGPDPRARDCAVSQLRTAGSWFAVIELGHEFPVRAAGGVEVVVTRGELSGDIGELLFQARDPLLKRVDICRSAETALFPSIVTQ